MKRFPSFHQPLRTLALLAALSLGLGNTLNAENLVSNPGFESNLDDWEIFVAPEHRGNGAVVDSGNTDEDPHEGKSAAQLSTDLPIRYALSTSNKTLIPVDPGERYKVSAWVKFSDNAEPQSGRAAVYLRLAIMESPKQPTHDPLGNIHIGLDGAMARNPDVAKLVVREVPHDWQKIEGVVEIPEGHSYVTLGLFAERIAGTVYWDEVTLEKVDKSTPLSPEVGKN